VAMASVVATPLEAATAGVSMAVVVFMVADMAGSAVASSGSRCTIYSGPTSGPLLT
jgi:hypothetical protein